jgi:hypothetical protein
MSATDGYSKQREAETFMLSLGKPWPFILSKIVLWFLQLMGLRTMFDDDCTTYHPLKISPGIYYIIRIMCFPSTQALVVQKSIYSNETGIIFLSCCGWINISLTLR